MPAFRLPALLLSAPARCALASAVLLALGGCAVMPDTAAPTAAGAPPRLVPIDPVLATVDAMAPPVDPAAAVAGSADDLRRRADALRGM